MVRSVCRTRCKPTANAGRLVATGLTTHRRFFHPPRPHLGVKELATLAPHNVQRLLLEEQRLQGEELSPVTVPSGCSSRMRKRSGAPCPAQARRALQFQARTARTRRDPLCWILLILCLNMLTRLGPTCLRRFSRMAWLVEHAGWTSALPLAFRATAALAAPACFCKLPLNSTAASGAHSTRTGSRGDRAAGRTGLG